ncbi:MAG TPA: lipopolysaccharide biosynthesis protein [Thermoleophilaceae bacterium]|jgi:O-antigen/teichoic acid export membrane protein
MVDRGDGAAPAAHERLHRVSRSDRSLLLRSVVTVGSRGLAKAAQLVFLVVAARLLNVEEFATYSYILVLVVVFTVVSDTGLPLVSSRDVAAGRGRPEELYWTTLPVVAVSAVIAAVALVAVAAVGSGPGASGASVALAALFVVGNRFFDLGATMLRGVGRLNLDAALEAGGAVLFIAGATLAMATGHGVITVLAVLCAKEWLFAGLSYLALRADIGPPRRAEPERWRRLLRIGIRLSLASTALALVMRIPLLILGNTGNAHDIAWFSAAQRFGDATLLLATSAGFGLLPGIAYLGSGDPQRARRLVWRVLAGLGAACAALAAVSVPFASDLMRLIFGASFEGGGDALAVLLAGLPAYAVVGVAWYALIAFDGEASTLNISLGGLAVAAAVGALAVPGGGAVAASWTYVSALTAMAVLSLVVLNRRLAPGRAWSSGSSRRVPAAESRLGP